MTLRNTQSEYGSLAKFFHWIIVLFILGLTLVGFFADSFPESNRGFVINLHKLFGLGLLILVVLRLIWTLVNTKPKLPGVLTWWAKLLERTVHFILYVCLFVMPLSGWIMTTAAGQPPRFMGYKLALPGVPVKKSLGELMWQVHSITIWILMGLIVLHIAAALKHHFWDKDDVLRRMWFKRSSS